LTVVEPEGRPWDAPESGFDFEHCEDLSSMIDRDVSWKAMLGEDEREATEEEVAAAVEAEHGPILAADGEG
jgi:hypothetical protein